MNDTIIWSVQPEIPGGGLYYETNKCKLYVQPDMDKQHYYWIVVWPGVKEKFDKKKGQKIRARPQMKEWGTQPTKELAKEAALERASRPRPRAPGELEEQEASLSL